jgi:hypothetical protein
VQYSVVQCSEVQCSAVYLSEAPVPGRRSLPSASRVRSCGVSKVAGLEGAVAVHCSVQCSAVQCSAVQCGAVHLASLPSGPRLGPRTPVAGRQPEYFSCRRSIVAVSFFSL